MTTTITKLLTLLMIIILASCSDGDPGPAGAQGPQGPAGAPGPQGAKGDPGTANVTYSEWMDIEWDGLDYPNYKTMKMQEPLITSEFSEKGGMILFFLRMVDGDLSLVLPTPWQVGKVTLVGVSQFQSGESGIGLIASTIDGSDIPDPEGLSSLFDVRYVLIPGGTLTTGGRVDHSYESLQRRYNIPD